MSTPRPPEAAPGGKIAQTRKAITAALGVAVTLILLIPEETIPEEWRPLIGVILGIATVAGVYRVPNAPSSIKEPHA